MNKVMDILIAILSGIVVGMIMTAIILQPRKTEIKCDDGWSEQVEDGIHKKTYTPALDTCKDSK